MDNIELHLYLCLGRRWESECDVRVNTSQREQYGGTVHLFIGTAYEILHSCPLQKITIMTQTLLDQSVISSLSRCSPSSWDMPLCRSFMDDSFNTAFERICRRCFFLQDLRRRSIPPTVCFLRIGLKASTHTHIKHDVGPRCGKVQ